MAAMNEKDVLRLTKEIYQAYDSGDWNLLRKNVTDDVKIISPSFNRTFNGPNGAVDYFRNNKEAFNLKITVDRQIACGDQCTVEYTARGTHQGSWMTPIGNLTPTGKNVEVHVCHVIQCRDNKVAEIRAYFDMASTLVQLGIGIPEGVHR